MLLAIDTSAGTSVAVVDRAAGILAEHSSDDTRRHAEVIGDLISACLTDSGVAVGDLSGVVAGMGPGPFTGLRVGIAAARAFAVGAGKIVVPVVSHDALAFGQDGPLLVATDARRREVYWTTYSGTDAAGLPVRTHGPALAKATDLEQTVQNFTNYRLLEARTVSAGALGMLAETLYANRRPFATDEPLYLRSPDVTLSAGPKRVTA
ncbi:MAG: tRNA (adenosine(37)-N6)-threonylcarbamoyltransferase complex dimerization subunit type 1 TsaB [Salinibacterium sp.]|nr:tRNA (adenosine(37)-N6)-threonylcarbamoyltransferase complex dimerization subunit type 1 TsaB [Salinibacterium sp.]